MTINIPRRQFDADGNPVWTAPEPESAASIQRRIAQLENELTAKWPQGGYCYTAEHRAWAQQKLDQLKATAQEAQG